MSITPPIRAGSKHPFCKYKHYRDEPATVGQILKWAYAHPECNYGVITGRPSGIVVIEADDDEAKALVRRRCPPTPMLQRSASPKRSEHRVYRYRLPDGWDRVPTRGLITVEGERHALDVRADGGIIVGPCSRRPDTGLRYDEELPWTAEVLAQCPVFDPAWLDYLPPDPGERSGPRQAFPDVPLGRKQELALEWLLKRPGSQQGKGADNYAYALAVDLLWGWDLSPEEALPVFLKWGELDTNLDSSGDYYPWTEKELSHKLDDAEGVEDENGRPRGWLLAPQETAYFNERIAEHFRDKQAKESNETESGMGLYNKYFLETDDFFKAADQEKTQYLITPFLPQGGVNILSGGSFAGKSVFIRWLIGRMLTGQDMMNWPTKQPDIVYFNGDYNRRRAIAQQIRAGMATAKRVGNRFHEYNMETLGSDGLTADKLKIYCDLVWGAYGERHLLVIADTLRPLLFLRSQKGDDLDAVVMTKMLYPFKQLTALMGGKITLLFLYHNARTTGEYYGAGSFMNYLDSYWNYLRKPDERKATIRIQTRETFQEITVCYQNNTFVLPAGTCQDDLDSCANNGQTCDAIVALVAGHGKLSQNKVEEQLMATGVKRNLIRSAYRLLEHYDVIKAGRLTGPDAYDKMKARLDW